MKKRPNLELPSSFSSRTDLELLLPRLNVESLDLIDSILFGSFLFLVVLLSVSSVFLLEPEERSLVGHQLLVGSLLDDEPVFDSALGEGKEELVSWDSSGRSRASNELDEVDLRKDVESVSDWKPERSEVQRESVSKEDEMETHREEQSSPWLSELRS